MNLEGSIKYLSGDKNKTEHIPELAQRDSMYQILVNRNNIIVQMFFCLSGSMIRNKPSPFRAALGHGPYQSKRNPKTHDI